MTSNQERQKSMTIQRQGQLMASSVFKVLLQRKQQLVVAESCTGGLLGSYITSVSGVSQVFCGGFITYSNESKTLLLQVPSSLIIKHGAVSAQVVEMMATNALKVLPEATVSLAISGIAGPTGETADKPVGTVFIAYSDCHGSKYQRFQFSGSRLQIQHESCISAMQLLLDNIT